jgi:hypothetical protein
MLKRGEEIARAAQAKKVSAVAHRLRELLRNASITVDDSRVIVSGRGLLWRFLDDPDLRFLGGTL